MGVYTIPGHRGDAYRSRSHFLVICSYTDDVYNYMTSHCARDKEKSRNRCWPTAGDISVAFHCSNLTAEPVLAAKCRVLQRYSTMALLLTDSTRTGKSLQDTPSLRCWNSWLEL